MSTLTKPIGIKPLTQPEVTKLIGKSTFNTLHPLRCGCCSNATDFARRVFKVQDDMLEQLAKLTAKPIEQVRIEMEALVESMEQNEGKAE